MGDHALPAGGRVFRSVASRAADGSVTNDFAGLVATPADSTGLHWTLRQPDQQVVRLDYSLVGDTAVGALTGADGTRYPLLGVRFDSADVSLIAPTLAPVSNYSQPTVVLRLDDAPETDRDFVERLRARGLVAEIAVPTRRPGQLRAATWDDVARWRTQGMGIVMHSRYHFATGADGQHFIAEIVGGFAEMRTHGFATHVFVQPGTWRDSIYFDSPQKLSGWRGALLRTFTTVAECYAYGPWLPRTYQSPLGMSHITISDGMRDSMIQQVWTVAQRPNHATVFLIHTHSLRTQSQLDWFLDLVAAARARGVVRVLASTQDLFFVSPASPPLVEPEDSVRGTGTEIQPGTP